MSSAVQQPLRVLQVTRSYFPEMGGVETHVYEIAPRLRRAGIHVTILTTDRSGRLPRREMVNGIEVIRVRAWPSDKDYFFAPDLARVIGMGWSVVHCQGYNTLAPGIAMLAARRARLPYLLSFHTGGDTSAVRSAIRPLQWRLMRPLLAGARRLIAVSTFEANFFRARLGLPDERFTVIPNGVDLPVSQDAAVPVSSAEGPLIVSVGRLERYKGHHRLIAALPMVLQHKPQARVRIVGSGPYEGALRQLASDLKVADHVSIGPIPPSDRQAMTALLKEAALMTLLSEYEAHPLAVLEALGLGRPVLVAETSGLAELAQRELARAIPLNSSASEVAAAVLRELESPLVTGPLDLPTWDDCAARLIEEYRAAVGSL